MLSSRHSFLKSLLLYYYTRVLTGTDTTRSSQSYLLLLQQKGRKFGRNSPIIKGECQPPSGGPQIKERGSPIPQMVNMHSRSWHCKEKLKVLICIFLGIKELCIFFNSLLQLYTKLYHMLHYIYLHFLRFYKTFTVLFHSIVIIWVKQSENGRQVEASFASELSFF